MVGGKDKDGDTAADQLILAPDPKDGQLGEVSEGSWIYYIEPKDQNDMVERPERFGQSFIVSRMGKPMKATAL